MHNIAREEGPSGLRSARIRPTLSPAKGGILEVPAYQEV